MELQPRQLPGLPGSTAGSSSPNTGSGATTPGSRSAPDGPGNNPLVLPITSYHLTSYLCPPRETGGLGLAACEVEEDVDYAQQELQSVVVPSLSACVTACLRNSVCRGVSLAGDNCSLKYSLQHRLVSSLYLNLFYNYSAHIYY